MASSSENLYVTFVDVDHDLLKVWGQRNRIGATYIERQLSQLLPEFNQTSGPNPSLIHKGMFCFAKYTDDNYYRARIISNVQGNSVGVLFVDYGNKDFINISNIRIQEGNEGEVVAKMAEQAEEYYLARVIAPAGGWTKEIVSEIRRDICYEEFVCRAVAQVGDQRILEILFHDEDFSNYLIKKQIARPVTVPAQTQMILSYCSLVPNVPKQNSPMREMPRNFSVPPPPIPSGRPLTGRTPPLQSPNNEIQDQQLFGRRLNPMNFSQPRQPTGLSGLPVRFHKASPNASFFPNQGINHSLNDQPRQPGNPVNNLMGNQCDPLNQMQVNPSNLLNSFNTVMIEALAQQIKQFIIEDKSKTETTVEENIPHNYVNSVLEVGSTHSAIVSYIDDGPWSFSIQLLSSENELNNLMEELARTELVPIKTPVILGHPCIGASAQYGNLCRGVIVSISLTAVKVYFVDFGNTEDLPVSSIYELPPRFFKTRVLSQKFSLSGLQKVAYSDDIKRFFKEVVQEELLMLRVTSLEGDNLPNCELYLKDKNIKRILNEKIRELRSSPPQEPPKVGETEDVVVTWVESPQKFFVQLHKYDVELNNLKKELEECSLSKAQTMAFQELRIGLKCICQYESDGNWYRAVITSLSSENAITVFYIDYGNTETVNISRLRKVEGNRLINQMTPQGIQCCLKGFENEPNDEEKTKHLEALILEKDFKMTVVSSDCDRLCVHLFENGENVARLLLSRPPQQNERICENVNTPKNDHETWDDPKVTVDSGSKSSASTFEKKSRTPDSIGSFDKRNPKNTRGDKNKGKSNTSRNFSDSKNNESQSNSRFKKRFEEKGSWREEQRKTEAPDPNYKSSSNKGFKQDKENMWNERKPPGGGRGNKQESDGWNERKPNDGWNDRKATDGWNDRKANDGWSEVKTNDGWGDRKPNEDKFGSSRGSRQQNSRKPRDDRFGGGGGKTFKQTRANDDWHDSAGSSFDSKKRGPRERSDKIDKSGSDRIKKTEEPKDSKLAIRKDDIAPRGSKFEERTAKMGTCEKAIVTFYLNPHEFYVQLLGQEDDFKKMMQEIQTYYSDKHSLKERAQCGDIVISQFFLDNILYRAEVVRSIPVTVRYVDYGNQEVIGPRKSWPVAKQFLKLPKQAVRCRLSNLLPKDLYWPPPGSKLDKFFEEEEYKCTFVNFENGVYEIKMEGIESGKNVASEIIAAGLGIPKEPKLGIPEIHYSLLPNQVLKLFVSHVENTSKFFVIINSKSVELIEKELKAYSENKKNQLSSSETSLEPGNFCLLSDDSGSWLRAIITEKGGQTISAWFCDRGDSIEVPVEKVTSLPDHLKHFQPQAVECYLHEISGSISVEEEEKFKCMVEHKFYLVSILSQNDKRLAVTLYDENGKKLDVQKDNNSDENINPISHFAITTQKVPVMISSFESPKEIYIQSSLDFNELLELSDKLAQHYDNNLEDEDVAKGLLVAAKSLLDETWYRGEVVSVSEDDVEVFYIDFGNRENIPRDCVKKLDVRFYDLSAFAKKVSLDVQYNDDMVENLCNKLSELTQDKEMVGYFVNFDGKFLAEFLLDGKRLTQLLSLGSSDDKFEKLLPSNQMKMSGDFKKKQYFPERDEEESSSNVLKVFVSHIDNPNRFWVHKEATKNDLHQFQEKLEKCCQALPDKQVILVQDVIGVFFSGTWYRAKVLSVDDHLTVRFVDYGNVLEVRRDGVKELTSDLIDVPVFATCYSLKGVWNEDATTKFEEIILQHPEDPVVVVVLEEGDPAVVDLLIDGQSIVKLMSVDTSVDDFITVYLTHSNSPDDFYIQRESCTELLEKLTSRLLEADDFDVVASPLENEIYLAKFADNDSWYRAKVIKKNQEDYEVFFIDYGNISRVDEVKALPEDVADIPKLAENCSLIYGNKNDTWSEAACKSFLEYTDGRPLKMKIIVNNGKKLTVSLYSYEGSVSEELEPLCEDDGRFNAYISHVNSLCDFYVQNANDEAYAVIKEKLEEESDCEDLGDKRPGTSCQARFTRDGMWYRAKILQSLDDGYEVFFIDYGNISVATELKKLPVEIEGIAPRALRCSLDLPEKNIPESVKEEFINLTSDEDSVFRVRIIKPGDVNVVSLKLNGRILERTLSHDADTFADLDFQQPSTNHGMSNSIDDETDDDKNSKKNLMTDRYLGSNLEDVASIRNETDEEKTVKIAIADGCSEGFKSDDEKGKTEAAAAFSVIVNATDNELIEETEETAEEVAEIPMEDEEIVTEDTREQVEDHAQASTSEKTESTETQVKADKNQDEKIVPGISRGESEKELNGEQENPRRKVEHSEKLVPGSISRGISLGTIPNDSEPIVETAEKQISQSAPNTPKPTRLKDSAARTQTDQNDRLVPGCISTAKPLNCSQSKEKISPDEKIVPGSINGSLSDD